MHIPMPFPIPGACAAIFFAFALSAEEPSDPRGWLHLGVRLFKQGQYFDAIRPLQKTLELDPDSGTARLLLAHRFIRLHYVPARSPLDVQMVRKAQQNLRKVLEADADDSGALHATAFLNLNEQRLDDAQRVYEKLIALDPQDASAVYALGYIATLRWYPEYQRAATRLGMSLEDPGGHTGPFGEPVRTEMALKCQRVLDQGIENARSALALNPRFGEAMGLMHSLIGARAYLRESIAEYRRDKEEAYDWLRKSIEARRQAGKQP